MVRMWVENSHGGPDAWRGSIHEIASGRRLYVTGPGEIADFITFRLLAREDCDKKP